MLCLLVQKPLKYWGCLPTHFVLLGLKSAVPHLKPETQSRLPLGLCSATDCPEGCRHPKFQHLGPGKHPLCDSQSIPCHLKGKRNNKKKKKGDCCPQSKQLTPSALRSILILGQLIVVNLEMQRRCIMLKVSCGRAQRERINMEPHLNSSLTSSKCDTSDSSLSFLREAQPLFQTPYFYTHCST